MQDVTISGLRKKMIQCLERMSSRYGIVKVFGDCCSLWSSALEKPFSPKPSECEGRYLSIASQYNQEELYQCAKCFSLVMQGLEYKRESFLGPVLEDIGAANTCLDQFFTPACVATMMARCNNAGLAHKDGEIITVNDPACGCGVTLIAQAEELLRKGVKQRDIFLIGGDIDRRACDVTFIELSLLGYSAMIEHADALSRESFSDPRFTFGYFAYGTEWRIGERDKGVKASDGEVFLRQMEFPISRRGD